MSNSKDGGGGLGSDDLSIPDSKLFKQFDISIIEINKHNSVVKLPGLFCLFLPGGTAKYGDLSPSVFSLGSQNLWQDRVAPCSSLQEGQTNLGIAAGYRGLNYPWSGSSVWRIFKEICKSCDLKIAG